MNKITKNFEIIPGITFADVETHLRSLRKTYEAEKSQALTPQPGDYPLSDLSRMKEVRQKQLEDFTASQGHLSRFRFHLNDSNIPAPTRDEILTGLAYSIYTQLDQDTEYLLRRLSHEVAPRQSQSRNI